MSILLHPMETKPFFSFPMSFCIYPTIEGTSSTPALKNFPNVFKPTWQQYSRPHSLKCRPTNPGLHQGLPVCIPNFGYVHRVQARTYPATFFSVSSPNGLLKFTSNSFSSIEVTIFVIIILVVLSLSHQTYHHHHVIK